jgi:hypothetical protein
MEKPIGGIFGNHDVLVKSSYDKVVISQAVTEKLAELRAEFPLKTLCSSAAMLANISRLVFPL